MLNFSDETFTGIRSYVKKHPEFFSILLLAFLCGMFLFWGLNFYPLLDVDETRYAVMSRDLINSDNWNILLLNMEPFLEKPPLYFWFVGLSIKLCGSFNAFAVRLPIALLASFVVFYTYFFGKKIISRKFGLISAIVLLTSVFFLILSHVAILDMLLTVWITCTLYSGFLSHFVQDKYKKYCWWGFWTFAALGFLAKGILALAIPLIIIIAYNFATKTLKEMFKPINFLVGFIIFLLISLPWHIMMYIDFGNKFIREYFLYHHFARFVDSAHIGRKHSLFYFIPVFLVAFMPWSFIFIASIIDGIKKLILKYKNFEGNIQDKLYHLLDAQSNEQKLILFSIIYFIVTFGIVSISSTKLPTYILPAIPAASLLTGYFWCNDDKKNMKAISISTHIIATIFILATLIFALGYIVIPKEFLCIINPFKYTALIGCSFIGILLLLRLKSKQVLSIFSTYVITMFFVISFAVIHLFNILYAGGENELVKYSSYANTKNTRLITFDFAVKPSTMIQYQDVIYFVTDPDFDKLYKLISNKRHVTYVIIKNRHMADGGYSDKINSKLILVEKGKKYSLYINQKLPKKLLRNPFIMEQ